MVKSSSIQFQYIVKMNTDQKVEPVPITRIESFEIDKKVSNNEIGLEKKEVVDIPGKEVDRAKTTANYISLKQVR